MAEAVLSKEIWLASKAMPTMPAWPDIVWNIRLWSTPLVQSPEPSACSISGLVLNDIWECAIVVSARASSTPLGEPRPVVRS